MNYYNSVQGGGGGGGGGSQGGGGSSQQQQQQQQQAYLAYQQQQAYAAYITNQERINDVTMTIENPNVVGSGYIRHPPQKRFQGNIIQQPLTCAVDYETKISEPSQGNQGLGGGGGGYQQQASYQNHYQTMQYNQPLAQPRHVQSHAPSYGGMGHHAGPGPIGGGYHQLHQQQRQTQRQQHRGPQQHSKQMHAPPTMQQTQMASAPKPQMTYSVQQPVRTQPVSAAPAAPAQMEKPKTEKLTKSQLKRRRKKLREGN